MCGTTESNENYIIGRNAVLEALKSGRVIDSIASLPSNEATGSLKVIISKAKERKIILKQMSRKALDLIAGGKAHQGVIAFVGAKEYCTVEDILRYAELKHEYPFLIIADGIEDPHNLGAIIRTAECSGAHGIIIPKRRAAGLTESVNKSSAGALEYVNIARVSNVASTIEYLKSKGLWIYGADMDGQNYASQNLKGPVALVIGSEGKGISNLVRDKCDFILSLPMKGKINSLNASVAAGILMYEIMRQRT
ncbi:MAG: 23S rRNA (guanosine(2251)-2'-O)-methyltransferase RlmB [Acutalibacteraceae bacterium]